MSQLIGMDKLTQNKNQFTERKKSIFPLGNWVLALTY